MWLLQKSIESGESPLVQHVEARRSSRRQTAAFARNAITKMLASPDKTRFIAEKKKKNTFVDLQGSSEDTNEMKKSGNLFPLFTSKIKVVEKSVDQLNGPLSKLPKVHLYRLKLYHVFIVMLV